ncbi:Protein phosphatase 1 regulatory subunit 7 [Portunus trituberculatus]|uniref:Dynein axonemal assembly factor 1 homolog n=1 Tax=Portunus trituberculatus TaxID=210409 RepID=A0A5B7FIU7_PORTR|nr:Protein phosphatase 1 regulatory subunit 7 [Portunus trituberculatus]
MAQTSFACIIAAETVTVICFPLLQGAFPTQFTSVPESSLIQVHAENDGVTQVIENLDGLTNLNSIFLGKNRITKLQNMDSLINLKILGVQSNRLTKIEGLGRLVNLEQLYCSHNGIEVLEGLDNNVKLQTLDMAVNRIKKIENISHLTEIEEFWVFAKMYFA